MNPPLFAILIGTFNSNHHFQDVWVYTANDYIKGHKKIKKKTWYWSLKLLRFISFNVAAGVAVFPEIMSVIMSNSTLLHRLIQRENWTLLCLPGYVTKWTISRFEEQIRGPFSSEGITLDFLCSFSNLAIITVHGLLWVYFFFNNQPECQASYKVSSLYYITFSIEFSNPVISL